MAENLHAVQMLAECQCVICKQRRAAEIDVRAAILARKMTVNLQAFIDEILGSHPRIVRPGNPHEYLRSAMVGWRPE